MFNSLFDFNPTSFPRPHMETANQNTKIFFDISSTVEYLSHHPHYSGIQRVVAMIISEYQKLSDHDKNLWISFLHPKTNEHLAFPLNEIEYEVLESPVLTREMFQEAGILPGMLLHLNLLQKYLGNKVKYYFHRTRYDIAALFKNNKIFQKRGFTANQWRQDRKQLNISSTLKNHIRHLNDVITPNDHLILLDSTWEKKHIDAFKIAKKHGMKIVTFVHDLIPISAVTLPDSGVTKVFYNWIVQSTKYTDFYLTNSEYTKQDLKIFLKKQNILLPITAVPLAQTGVPITKKTSRTKASIPSDFIQLPDDLKPLTSASNLCRSILNESFVLHVGTIEIRKNTWRLALAWKKLLEEGHTDLPRLVFAGRRGWMNEHFFDLLQATGNLYGYVTIIDHVSDEELELLYKNCLFATMVSTYEGWGLPIGEALSYGKTAVVSNSTSLPEVGMDLVEYCDPLSVNSIAEAIRRLVYEQGYRQSLENKIQSTHLRNWSDVAQNLKQIIEPDLQASSNTY